MTLGRKYKTGWPAGTSSNSSKMIKCTEHVQSSVIGVVSSSAIIGKAINPCASESCTIKVLITLR